MKSGWVALGLSVAAHAALVATLEAPEAPVVVESNRASAWLEVTTLVSTPTPDPKPPPLPQKPTFTRSAARVPSQPQVDVAQPALVESAVVVAPEASPAAEQLPGAPSLPTPTLDVPSSAPAPGGEVAPRAVDDSAISARLAAATAHCYPTMARRLNVSGTAQLDFCVGTQGEVASSSIRSSAGHGLLDSAARECVLERAAPFVGASGRCFSVPVRFTLSP